MGNRNVLLIGAGGDIGTAALKTLSDEEWNVKATKRTIVDLADEHSVAAFTKSLDTRFSHVVYAAAINEPRPFSQLDREHIDVALKVNLLSFLEILHAIVANMPSEGNRSITVISSLFGQTGREGRLSYSLSKHALEGAAKTLALELGPIGIRVNSISPGFIDTKLTRKNIPQDQITKLEERIPLGTLGTPEDIADAIAFLISEKARYITGTNLTIDGGFMAGGFFKND